MNEITTLGILGALGILMNEVRLFTLAIIYAVTWPKNERLYIAKIDGKIVMEARLVGTSEYVTAPQRLMMCWNRYAVQSIIFHEFYSAVNRKAPSFRTSSAMGIGMISIAAMVLAGNRDGATIIAVATLGTSVTFISTELRGFLRYSAFIAEKMDEIGEATRRPKA